ncbi:MAG TPA: hypothetical protein VER32_14015, partial [Pyrinomonadaceae bacterium]|nr:hypothetical protein [Pyrinomonadaceae bacterium]
MKEERGGRRWTLRASDAARARALARALGTSEVVARLLDARGVTTEEGARAVLRPSLEQLHDPALRLGRDAAVGRVLRAADAGERILIYGDYDADG